ncbi:SAM-dependent methyltransferase [Nonomuraea sp. NPDC050556]|uniref:SAM-dependent methyltransferase n=1 Tax=Nonomuraea sp. NPDC050556 TaxID=3364369 RepID=UPI0037A7D205
MSESAVRNLVKLNPAKAQPGRMVNAAVGGQDHFAADREAMYLASTVWEHSKKSMQTIPPYFQRLVRAMANGGVDQFIVAASSVPTGLPAGQQLHDIAAQIVPSARVVYLEHDVLVIVKARADLERGNDRIRVVEGDVINPKFALDDFVMRTFLDWSEPIGLVLPLHQLGGTDHLTTARTFLDRMVSGSYLGIHQVTFDHLPADRIPSVQKMIDETIAIPGIRSKAELEPIFDGLELLEPGITWVPSWRPDGIDLYGPPPEATGMYGALARVP